MSQAETSGSATTGAAAGKAKFDEFAVEKGVDLASVPLYNACTAGAHFPAVARQFSQAAGAQNGGDMGWVLAGQLEPALDQVLGGMTQGQGSYSMELSHYDMVPAVVQQAIVSKAKVSTDEDDD